jgi:hypothetical protein
MASFCDAQARTEVQDPSKLEWSALTSPTAGPSNLDGHHLGRGRRPFHKLGSTVYGLISSRHFFLDLSWKQFSSPSEK